MYYLSRRFDDSIKQCRRGLEIDSAYVLARIQLALALEQKGMANEAISELERARDQAGAYAVTDSNANTLSHSSPQKRIDLPMVHALLGHAYAKAGRISGAQKEMTILKTASRTRYIAPSWVAVLYIAIGDKDEAFSWLQKSYQIDPSTCCTSRRSRW
ncbi:MAG TPA: hypothetical protein VJX16_00475 [Terriglobales bacterium]|nr:hypothetical protein [Terriglobales bacterium]